MVNKLGTVKIHSSIDIITNSSTEIFCTVKGNDIKIIQNIIDKVIEELGCNCLKYDNCLYVEPKINYDSGNEEIIEGQYDIWYEQGSKPCKLIENKLKELLEFI